MAEEEKSKSTIKIRRLITVEEAAAYLGISPRTIYNGLGPGAKRKFPIKPKRIGRAVRFDVQEIEKFISSQ